jgi:hypothetical protein
MVTLLNAYLNESTPPQIGIGLFDYIQMVQRIVVFLQHRDIKRYDK